MAIDATGVQNSATGRDVPLYKMIIDGREVDAASGETLDVYNPATGKLLGRAPKGGAVDVEAAVRSSRAAFDSGSWSRMSAMQRSATIYKMADIIEARREELALLETRNAGKTLADARGDVDYTVETFRYFAGATPRILGDTIPVRPDFLTYTLQEPVGVCGLIVPWNYPLLMAAWKVAPALAAGCTAVLKPASYTPLSVFELGKIALEAGVPEGVLNVVSGPGSTVGEALVNHPLVDKIAFTGETYTGQHILASAARQIKKVTLELGGKNANIVFEDADLDAAVRVGISAIYANNGQACGARARILVQASVYDRFVEDFTRRSSGLRVGDPLDPETQIGAMISQGQVERAEEYVGLGTAEGGRVLFGGRRPVLDKAELAAGHFYSPTAIEMPDHSSKVMQDEIFGPVVAVGTFKDEDEAVRLTNGTRYGLLATVWTNDLRRAHRLARRIKAGGVWFNTEVNFFTEAPFGGYGQSGLGRELGPHGLDQYAQTKVVGINLGEAGNPFNV